MHITCTHLHHSPIHTTCAQVDQLRSDSLEAQALAESRLAEIGELSCQLQETKKALEAARLERSSVPEAAVKEAPTYKSLQLQYSVTCQGEVWEEGVSAP